jgi:hypothetical protein
LDPDGQFQTDSQKALTEELVKLSKRDNGYIKSQTRIEIQRAWNDNGQNGCYFQSKLSVTYNGIKLNEINIQSTPDWKDKIEQMPLDWIRLPAGVYIGELINRSKNYIKPIHIINETLGAMKAGAPHNGDCLIHPNVKTALGETQPYGQGNLNGRPLSLACQIGYLEGFNEMTEILESLGFHYGDPKAGPWTAGDKIKIIINDYPDSWAGPYTIGQ